MSKRILALLLALALVASVFAACGNDSSSSSSSSGGESKTSSTASGDDASTPEDTGDEGQEPSGTSTGPDPTDEFYEWTHYWYYDSQAIKEWGVDAASKHISNLFNINIKFTKPDADPESKINIMFSGDDLPDSLKLPQGRILKTAAQSGKLVDFEQFMYPEMSLNEDMPEEIRELLKVDGVFYGPTDWFRTIATGGNYQWILNSKEYEDAGKPALNTLEDIHKFMLDAKDRAGKTYNGQDIQPFGTYPDNRGYYIYWPLFRALGGCGIVEGCFTQEDGKIDFAARNELMVEALKMGNQWFNEGLYTADVFTQTPEQWLETVTNGRPAIMWYDFSQDDTNNFRRIVQEQSEGKVSYEVLGHPMNEDLKDYPMFPAAEGVDVVFGDENNRIGGDVSCISVKAERPQRIADVWAYMVSREGSINMMYGPSTEEDPAGLWTKLDADGIPQLTKPYGDYSSAEFDAAGAWFWASPANADWVDTVKFAVNDQQPEEKRNWTVTTQAHMTSFDEENPVMGQKIVSDQNIRMNTVIDAQSDLGVNLKAITDEWQARVPQILMAKDEAEFNKLLGDLVAFAESNNIDEICSQWQANFDSNIEKQGFNVYDAEYDVYKLNK
ncbi:MAG: hypothetical protein HFE95_09170 [Acutalibacter sp.]|nr:hypothetical protein [Acutalibacter sp.]